MKLTYYILTGFFVCNAITGMQRKPHSFQELTEECSKRAVDYGITFVDACGKKYVYKKITKVPEPLHAVTEFIVQMLEQGFVLERFFIRTKRTRYVQPSMVLPTLESNFSTLSSDERAQYQAVYEEKKNYLLRCIAANAPGCFVMVDIRVANFEWHG